MGIPLYCLNLGIVEVGLMVLAIGLSLISAKLLAKKPDTPIVDDKPTTLTSRGSYIPWLIGRRRVGPVFAWAGGRYTVKEKAQGGGKGFFSPNKPKTIVYYESGWHQLAMGPCNTLHGIYQGGQVIFQGPINSISHPSGTTVDLGKEGSFKIYWGEEAQATNATLASQVGVASRWPHLCYIHWHAKRLGQSPMWQLIEYDLERLPSQSVLTSSDAFINADITISSISEDIYAVNNGAPGTGYFDLTGDQTPRYGVTDRVALTGNSMSDTDLIIASTSTYQVLTATYGTVNIYTTYTRLKFEETIVGADANGELTLYTASNIGGVNPAHAIAELLFADFPLGLQLSQDDWDIDSLEDLGVLLSTSGEELPCSMIAVNGDDAKGLLGMMLQDIGVMIPIHPDTGLVTFVPLREPTSTPDEIKNAQISDPLPEVETIHGDILTDKYIFTFSDWEHAFKDMTIAIDEDGQAEYLQHQRAKKIKISIATDIVTASKIAERRSQEELAGGTVYSVTANHGARMLYPGVPVTLEDGTDILRVTSVGADPETGKVKIKLISDVYGVQLSSFENEGGGGEYNYDPALQDEHFTAVEIPEYWLAGGPMTIMIPRIRHSADVSGAHTYLSQDDTTYTFVGDELTAVAGGVLIDAVAIDGESSIAQGPTFTVKGPDIGTALDLSADETNWRLGRQLLIWGNEVAFVEKITALGGDTYRLDGILRARWDTEKELHPAGQPVFIFEANDLELLQDLLLAADTDLYVKTQPYTSGSTVNIDSSPKLHLNNTVGKGLVPMRPVNVSVSAPAPLVPAYETGDDVTIHWGYMSSLLPGTGAGMQNAGDVTGSSPIDGEFKLEIYNLGAVLKRTEILTTNSYTYSNANIIADLGSEVDFTVKITAIRGGSSSETKSLLITKE